MNKGKAISVKIPTQKLITALQVALDKLKKSYASQEADEAKYDKSVEKWQKDTLALALKNINKATGASVSIRYNDEVNVDFNLPAGIAGIKEKPDRNYDRLSVHGYNEQVRELENALNILKMTDEETVNTSTYNAVARYL